MDVPTILGTAVAFLDQLGLTDFVRAGLIIGIALFFIDRFLRSRD